MITIRGIIIPRDWDEKGNVVSMALLTHDEDEYLIDSQNNDELKALMREEVHISGEVKTRQGKKVIQVKKYGISKALKQQPPEDNPRK